MKDIQLENKTPFFIYGVVEGGLNHVRISVTKSQGNPPQYPPRDPNIFIRDAEVYLSKQNWSVKLQLKWNPNYKTFQFILPDSNYYLEVGTTYTLLVIVEQDTFQATTFLPPSPELMAVDTVLTISPDYFEKNYSYDFFVHWRYPVKEGLIVFGYPVDIHRLNYVSYTRIAQGKKCELFIYREAKKKGRISIHLYRYNDDYLKFARSMTKYEDDITVPIYSNIQGAYGIFYAFYTDTMSIPYRIE